MKNLILVVFTLSLLSLSSCGAENDAKDVCNCYKEVIKLEGKEADEKMEECVKLLSDYLQKHEEAGSLEEFNKAYNDCR